MKLLLMYKQPLSLKHMESPNTKKNKNIAQIQVGVHLFLMNINFFFFKRGESRGPSGKQKCYPL